MEKISHYITGNGYNSKEEAEAAVRNVITEDTELYLHTNTKVLIHFFRLDGKLVIEVVRRSCIFRSVIIEEPIIALETLSKYCQIELDQLAIDYVENGVLIIFK